MHYLTEFSLLATTLFMALMSPGPDFMVTLKQTIQHGKRYAYYSSLGIGAGIAIHLSYTFLGMNLLMSTLPSLFLAIKILGALYLIYLGVGSLRSHASKIAVSTEKKGQHSYKKAFFIGFLSDVLNPKSTLFFLSIFTSIVSVQTPFYIQMLYGFFCIVANILWYMFIAHLLSKESHLKRFNQHRLIIDRFIGIILIALGIKLIFDS